MKFFVQISLDQDFANMSNVNVSNRIQKESLSRSSDLLRSLGLFSIQKRIGELHFLKFLLSSILKYFCLGREGRKKKGKKED